MLRNKILKFNFNNEPNALNIMSVIHNIKIRYLSIFKKGETNSNKYNGYTQTSKEMS